MTPGARLFRGVGEYRVPVGNFPISMAELVSHNTERQPQHPTLVLLPKRPIPRELMLRGSEQA